jgi:hypothetical protein
MAAASLSIEQIGAYQDAFNKYQILSLNVELNQSIKCLFEGFVDQMGLVPVPWSAAL